MSYSHCVCDLNLPVKGGAKDRDMEQIGLYYVSLLNLMTPGLISTQQVLFLSVYDS